MKGQLCIPVAVLVSVGLVGFMKVRKPEHEKEDKRYRFGDIKVRVTRDVLRDYENELAEKQNRLSTLLKERDGLQEQTNQLQLRADKAKAETQLCEGAKKTTIDELASVQTERSNGQAENDKEKAGWTTEIQTLEKQLAARSAVCDFLKEDAQPVREFCKGPKEEAPKQEEAKAEEAKPEAPKAEEPKAEEPKAEAPKEEAPKPEEPKAEAPKEEAPKPEEAKAEAPKEEAPKPEEAKAEAPKEEAPKPEEAKAEAPKEEAPKAEEAKAEEAKAEPPKRR